jgi:hypothetical protein
MIGALAELPMRLPGIFVAALAAGVGLAQPILTARAGLINLVLGRVSIVGRGPIASGAAKSFLNAGEILSSETGRAEVLLNSGAVLRIGDSTRIRMDSVALTDTRVSVEGGSAVVTITELPKPDHVGIHIGGAVVAMKSAGVYRFDSDEVAGPWLRVFSGQAEVRTDVEYREVKHGQGIDLRTLHLAAFDPKNADELQQWAANRTVPPPFTTLAPMICYAGAPAAQPNTTPTEFLGWIKECLHK